MKLTCTLSAIVVILADAAQGFRLPSIIEPRQQQPKCSLYSGFRDSPSFTSFCNQLPRATKPVMSVANTQTPATSSAKKTPSISTQLFTFDGGKTSTMSPVHPAVSSAAASKTFEMQNYTITTGGQSSSSKATASSKASSTDLEVNCYVNGSKLPTSECTRTAGLTRHHGYTHSYTTKTKAKLTSTSSAVAALSTKLASSRTSSSSTEPTSSPSKTAPKSSALRASGTTTSTPVSGMPTSSDCTRTMNLTHVHGYTYISGTALGASTAKLTSSVLASGSSKAATSSTVKAASNGTTTSVPLRTGTSSTFSTAFINSYDCNNITAAVPHRMGSSAQGPATTSAPSTSSTSSKARTTASSKTSTASQSKKGEATSSSTPTSSTIKTPSCSSTTTIIDATVTTLVPCATDVAKPAANQKRGSDPAFLKSSESGICDADVYCVNSTFVSDAPPSWHWDAIALKKGQACLEDNVFNTEWVESQCACAGL